MTNLKQMSLYPKVKTVELYGLKANSVNDNYFLGAVMVKITINRIVRWERISDTICFISS
jgi:hypothetical protein